MARTTKQLSGAAKDKMLRGLVAGSGVSSGDAARVSEALAAAVTEVRVRRDAWEALRSPRAEAPKAAPAAKPAAQKPTPAQQAAPAPAAAAAFDPYAFSAMSVLMRQGKAALAAALEKIDTLENLRALAAAQHLALDPALTDLAAVRSALIAGTERRIAERKAAAS